MQREKSDESTQQQCNSAAQAEKKKYVIFYPREFTKKYMASIM